MNTHFHTDHVGSLLRPPELIAARNRPVRHVHAESLDAAALRPAEEPGGRLAHVCKEPLTKRLHSRNAKRLR